MRAILPVVFVVLLSAAALANDGVNRYETGVAATLVHLDGPVAPEAGFRVLPGDLEGGADGDPAYRWAQRHAIAAVRLASRRAVAELGPSAYPLAIFDLASENGDTPIGWSAAGPRGRHPGGSHDGGMNLDLGYYLTSEKGKVETPDPAACTEHYVVVAGEAGKPEDANKCTGPADRLDVDHQALFLIELVRRHLDDFGGELLENIGVDAVVRVDLLGRLRAWQGKKEHGVTAAAVAELDRLFASSPYEGWATFHLHHVHVRLSPESLAARHARAVEAMIAEDRKVLAELQQRRVVLIAELSSSGLAREVDLRLGGSVEEVASVRFRKAGGEWETPEDPVDPLHHVVEVGPAGTAHGEKVTFEAQVTLKGTSQLWLTTDVTLPRQPAFLRVKVVPSAFVGRARVTGRGAVAVTLDHPPVFDVLVTKVELLVWRAGGTAEPERLPLVGPAWSTTVKGAALERAEADVTLSGRMHLRVPVIVGGGGVARP